MEICSIFIFLILLYFIPVKGRGSVTAGPDGTQEIHEGRKINMYYYLLY